MTAGPSFAAARMEDLTELMAFVDAECARAGVSDDVAFTLRLATEEAFVNIVQHGYRGPGPVHSTFSHDGDSVRLTLVDEAPLFDPSEAPTPDLDAELEDRQEGGLGWHLVHQLMDEVHHEAGPERGNVLTLVKHLGDSNED